MIARPTLPFTFRFRRSCYIPTTKAGGGTCDEESFYPDAKRGFVGHGGKCRIDNWKRHRLWI